MASSPSQLAMQAEALVQHGGGYLRNTVREPYVTCSVCTTPVEGYERCYKCQTHWREHDGDLADAVAVLAYGVGGEQSGWVMRGYKAPRPSADNFAIAALLTWVGVGYHATCAARLAGRSITHWATVPSLPAKLNAGEHRFHQIVAANAPCSSEAVLTSTANVAEPRAARRGHFISSPLPRDAHVLLLDDTWVEGGHVQSAALAVRAAGATRVSVFVVARWANRGFGANDAFFRQRATATYDPAICPWTGGACP